MQEKSPSIFKLDKDYKIAILASGVFLGVALLGMLISTAVWFGAPEVFVLPFFAFMLYFFIGFVLSPVDSGLSENIVFVVSLLSPIFWFIAAYIVVKTVRLFQKN